MIPTLALRLALAGWLAAAGLAITERGRGGHASRWAPRAAAAATALTTVAMVALGCALVRGDWSLTYVADFASRDTPWWYRLAGLWAGMAGSLLVWTWLLGLWTLVAVRVARREAQTAVVAVLSVLAAAQTALLVWAVPPFARLQIPAIDGGGLTPVLRHPAMLYHPLLLYSGQVGLAVPFALCVASRGRGLRVEAWLPAARRWAAVSLCLLGVAMVAGAHWAYVELGWGGYWAWDPVENAALLPWLAGVAFLHLTRRRGGEVAAARLADLMFVLGLGGTFLTRSGATGSVHAFGDEAMVGRVLALAVIAAVGLVAVVEWRARGPRDVPNEHPPATPGAVFSRERALGLSALLLGGLVAVIGFGTALPLLRHGGVLVSGRYFSTVSWPFALAFLALAGVGPRLLADGMPAAAATRRLTPALAGIPVAVAAWAALDGPTPLVVAAAGLGGATVALTAAELAERGRRWRGTGGLVAHLGLAVLLVGVTGTATGTVRTGVLPLADRGPGGPTLQVRGYVLRLVDLAATDAQGPGAAVRATIEVSTSGGRQVAVLRPKAMLSGAGQRVSVSGLRSTPAEDLQVTMRAVGPDGSEAVVDARVVPLAQEVWWGGLLVAAGLALTAAGRLRVGGAGTRSTSPTREMPDGRADVAHGRSQPRTRPVQPVPVRPGAGGHEPGDRASRDDPA